MKLFTPFSIPKDGMRALPRNNKAPSKKSHQDSQP